MQPLSGKKTCALGSERPKVTSSATPSRRSLYVVLLLVPVVNSALIGVVDPAPPSAACELKHDVTSTAEYWMLVTNFGNVVAAPQLVPSPFVNAIFGALRLLLSSPCAMRAVTFVTTMLAGIVVALNPLRVMVLAVVPGATEAL